MQLGIIGLGRMGGNMLRRLVERGHEPVGYDRAEAALAEARARGARTAASLPELARLLQPPRAGWMMVPQGAPVEATLEGLVPHLAAGDLVVDGGNSRWSDAPGRRSRPRWRGAPPPSRPAPGGAPAAPGAGRTGPGARSGSNPGGSRSSTPARAAASGGSSAATA